MKRAILFTILMVVALLQAQTITIKQARETAVGTTVTVEGIIFTPDYNLSSTSSGSYYIYDETGAINLYISGTPKAYNLGDKVRASGKLLLYNGLLEINPTAANVTKISSNNTLPVPLELKIEDFEDTVKLNNLESQLVVVKGLYRVGSAAWPANNSDANLTFNTNSSATTGITVRIDKDTDIDGTQEPSWPKDITGVLTQFKTSSTVGSGFQLLPRGLADIGGVLANEKNGLDKYDYSLSQNYPNPFNPTTKITFTMAKAGYVKVAVYNVMGQEVATLFNGYAKEGKNVVNFNAAGLNSGIYFCKMETAEYKSMIKMMLMK